MIFIYFLMILIPQMLHTSSNVAISFNMGIPPMLGCQSSIKNPQADCFNHKIGISPVALVPFIRPTILGKSTIINPSSSSATGLSSMVYYTQMHVNGYWGATEHAVMFYRFPGQQPLLQAPCNSGFSTAKNYTYTVVDWILFVQNMLVPVSNLAGFQTGSFFPPYSCSVGNLLGGFSTGSNDFTNYMFDLCVLYGNCSPSSYNNSDVSPSITPDLTQTFTYGASLILTVTAFSSSFNQASFPTTVSITLSDYFNNFADSTIDMYLPLHFVDPGTTYIGSDIS